MQKISAVRERALIICKKIKWLAPLLARLTLAVVFVQSGWGKLHHLDSVTEYFTQLGIPFPGIQAPFVALTEVLCGLAMGVGLLTRLASLPIIAMMVVAILTARLEDLHSLNDLLGFIEYLYIVFAVWLALEGPGPFSIDHLLCSRRDSLTKR